MIGGMYTLADEGIIGRIKEILEILPPIEKILGYAWIVLWFLAIWIYHIQLFLTGLFCLFLAYIIFSKSEEKKETDLPLRLTMDKSTKTLKVQKIYENNLKWEDNEICAGNAKLPTGSIKIGDTITNCDGNIAIRHKPTNTLLGAYNFE